MDALAEARLYYVRKASDNEERLNYAADVLFHRGMMSREETASIQRIRSPQDKARALIDSATAKGDAVSDAFVTAWESYPSGPSAGRGSPAAPERAAADPTRSGAGAAEALAEARPDYIRMASGNVERMNHIVDVLFHRGMMSYAEMASIQYTHSPRDKARALTDSARAKGDAASETFARTWESYRPSAAPLTSRADILEILEEMNSRDKLFALVNAAGLSNTMEIAEVISGHADDPRAATAALLRAIHREDLLWRVGEQAETRGEGREKESRRP